MAPTFVEVATRPTTELASPPPLVTPGYPALEFRAPDGSSLRITLGGNPLPTGHGLDVVALVDLFLRSRPCSR